MSTLIHDVKEHALSFAQQRLWFLDRFAPLSSVYNNGNTIEFKGPLEVERLRMALQQIVNRHDALRMTFHDHDGVPYAVISSEVTVELPVTDLSHENEETRQIKAHALAESLGRQPFVLSEAPPWRFSLIKLGPEHFSLVFVIRHIISDRWSLGLLLKEIVAFYEANGGETQLEPLPVTYTEITASQRQKLSDDQLEEKLAFWKDHLGEKPPVLDLPFDKPRPAMQTYDGKKLILWFSEEKTMGTKALARKCRASLFMTMMGAFKALLARYTQQDDLVMGTFVAGRNQVEAEGLIGLFVNTLAIRSQLLGDPSFSEMIKTVRKAMMKTSRHQDMPFEKLVEALVPSRDLSRSPLIQVAFNFHNVPMPKDGPMGMEMTCGEIDSGHSRLDLTLTLRDHDDRLELYFEYNTDLFHETRIQRMANHLDRLLDSAIADPNTPLSQLQILTEAEQGDLLHTWNNTQKALPEATSVYALISKQVHTNPQGIAVTYADESLTYEELDRRVAIWSNRLNNLGLVPGQRVGIYLERSVNMLVAMLASLRQGCAYLPLDPFYPNERLSYILDDAGVDLLLTQESLMDNIPKDPNTNPKTGICMDTPFGDNQKTLHTNDVAGLETAYLIYTSGSTGAPKGVMVPHNTVINFLNSMAENPGLKAGDTLIAVTTLSFDISVLELLLPLVTGARVVIAARQQVTDATLLADLIQQEKADVVQATPATWKLLLESGWKGANGLRILCGGEAMPREMADALMEQGASLYNMYGPTETTVWSSVGKVCPGPETVPVGLPIDNTQLHILTRRGAIQPLGTPGELFIGGDGVTLGYHNRPALTAERFVPDPFATEPGSRLYRTGDLCRRREDGLFNFLGRIDHQVKVRGFRIELGEIETLLATHDSVAECVAMADGDTGEQQLVAYVVPSSEQAVDAQALRDHLLGKLPEYMVPSLFLSLEQFPLTPNGKVDRKALPSPQSLQSNKEVTQARNDFELRLIPIWENLLKRSPIGTDDNFFTLGGHSLIGVRLFVEVEKEFGVRLTLPDLFLYPTIAGIAKLLKSGGAAATHSALQPLREKGTKPPLFCVRGLFLYKALAEHFDPDQPVYGIFLETELEVLNQGKGDSIRGMAERYVDTIRRAAPEGPYYVAGVSFGGIIALEIARVFQEQGETVALVSLFDAVLPNAITKRPIRWALYHGLNVLKKGPKYLWDKVFNKTKPIQVDHDAQNDFEAALVANRGAFYRAAMATYKPQPYDGDLTLYRALDETYHFGFKVDHSLGWSKIATGNLKVEFAPGGHLELLEEPYVASLAEKLQANLNEAQAKYPARKT